MLRLQTFILSFSFHHNTPKKNVVTSQGAKKILMRTQKTKKTNRQQRN